MLLFDNSMHFILAIITRIHLLLRMRRWLLLLVVKLGVTIMNNLGLWTTIVGTEGMVNLLLMIGIVLLFGAGLFDLARFDLNIRHLLGADIFVELARSFVLKNACNLILRVLQKLVNLTLSLMFN